MGEETDRLVEELDDANGKAFCAQMEENGHLDVDHLGFYVFL
jgi:hypothetical protein